MLKQRSGSQANIINNNVGTNQLDTPTSARATAISCPSEQDLRVPCYCEENVWRLAYRRIFGPPSPSSSPSSSSSSSSPPFSLSSSLSTDSDTLTAVDKENEQYYVVFISNDVKCCPMLNQRASKNPNEPCFWDYHVVLIQSHSLSSPSTTSPSTSTSSTSPSPSSSSAAQTHVLDMDSRLPYPCPLDEYLNETFRLDFIDVDATKKYSPKFRVVRAELFLQYFSSDRMHMFQDGQWSSPPPSYDCIIADLQKMELSMNMNMNMNATTTTTTTTTTGSMSTSMSNLNDYIDMKVKNKEPASMGEVMTMSELLAKFNK